MLYLDQSTFDDPARNVRGGIPVLFPICGPLAQSDYIWQGQRYSMKQHGFARDQAWSVIEQQSTRALLELRDNPQTRSQYPFSFCYQLALELVEDGLRMEQSLANLAKHSMPAQFGFHPYFLVGNKERLSFELPVESYRDNKSDLSGPFSGFDFTRPEIDWAFPHPSATKASFHDLERGLRVTVAYSPTYQALVFWTLRGQPFLCLEPWSSARLAFPHGEQVHQLAPGETLKCAVEIRVAVDSNH